MFLPFFYTFGRYIIINVSKKSSKSVRKPFDCYYHLPFFQILKYRQFIKEIDHLAIQIKKSRKLKKTVLGKIDERYSKGIGPDGKTIVGKGLGTLVKDLKVEYTTTKTLLAYVLGSRKGNIFQNMERDLKG